MGDPRKRVTDRIINLADGRTIHRLDGPNGPMIVWDSGNEPAYPSEYDDFLSNPDFDEDDEDEEDD